MQRRSSGRRAFAILAVLLGYAQQSSIAAPYGIGRTPSADEVRRQNIDVAPTGEGLPDGHGTAAQGQIVFQQKCAVCHGARGDAGDGAPIAKLVGGSGTLDTGKPLKTVGSYWPFATTLYDYINRAMPLGTAHSLSPDQVYAVCAYLLALNSILPADAELNAATLAAVKMPNRAGFFVTPNQPDAGPSLRR